jgi:hypothetical protein
MAAGLELEIPDVPWPVNPEGLLSGEVAKRVAAVGCYYRARSKKHDYVSEYRDVIDHEQAANKIRDFTLKWVKHFQTHGHVLDLPNPGGRPRTVDRKPIFSIINDIKTVPIATNSPD